MDRATGTYREIWQIAYPVMIGQLTHTAIIAVDTAFLGRLGTVELGASALGGLLYFVLLMMGFGVSMGMQIMVARRLGQGRREEVGSLVDHGLYLNLLLGVIFFASLQWLFPFLLSEMVRSPRVGEATAVYLDYRSWGIFFGLFNFAFQAMFIGLGRTRIILVATGGMAVLNIILDYLMIFGHGGFPAMGIGGSGLASALSEVAGTLIFVAAILIRRYPQQFSLFSFPKPQWDLIRRLGVLSLPMVFQNFLSLFTWFVFFVIIENIGEIEVAASNVIRSVYIVIMIPGWGLGSAANTTVSNLLGQGQADRAWETVKQVMGFSFAVAAVLALGLATFPHQIIGLYTDDPQIMAQAYGPLMIIASSILVFSLAAVGINAVTGTGNTRYALMMEVVAISLYLAYVLAAVYWWEASLTWIWGCEWVYWGTVTAFCLGYFWWGEWEKIEV